MKILAKDRLALFVERILSFLLFPFAYAVMSLFLFGIMRAKIPNLRAVREEFKTLMEENKGRPVIVCLNHLTRIDSMILPLIFVKPWEFWRFSHVPWHVLELKKIAFFPIRFICFFMKTLPLVRMGSRSSIQRSLSKVKFLLENGEMVVIFPEGKRSESGRIDGEDFQYGVGDIVRGVPGCKVLCTYLRADRQKAKSDIVPYASNISVSFKMIEPKPSSEGLRASREIASEIIQTLLALEKMYFYDADRK